MDNWIDIQIDVYIKIDYEWYLFYVKKSKTIQKP